MLFKRKIKDSPPQENKWGTDVFCKGCGKKYRQVTDEQMVGFTKEDFDVCPHCGYINGSSEKVEFFNFKNGS